MALANAKTDLTDSFLAMLPPAEGAGWLAKARNTARERWAGMGLPIGRDEYWKYTNPKGFTDIDPSFATTSAATDHLGSIDAHTLTFVDGVFDAAQSDAGEVEGLTLQRLSEVADVDVHWASGLFGVLEAASHDPVGRPLAALTTQMASEGVLIHVTATPDVAVRIRYVSTGGQPSLHHVVKIDAGQMLTVIEEGLAGARYATNMETDIADGAQLHHIRLQGPEDEVERSCHAFARLGTESVFKSFTLTSNGALTRNEMVIELTGDDANACIAGAATGDGTFHHDDTVFVTHDAVNCESRQVFKKVLRNGATGVFQGKILVQPGAQKTDGYQISQGLMLDDDSQFLAKPELEIYADDVACSHGSTVGAVDEEALFYLTSRGVHRREAQDMLVLAFLDVAIAEIADDGLADIVRGCLQDWMAGESAD